MVPGGRPRVAVIGRQNVGKSTLVNRLLGRREAIAHEEPGVTRDRREVPVEWNGRTFLVVDTGGMTTRPVGVEADVTRQASRAAEEADLALFLVDATAGITEEDELLAARLRRSERPVLVVANKVDSEAQDHLMAEFFSLGLGEPFAISALHGRGSGELLDRILELIPDEGEVEVEDEARFALVGRPNVGKSSLFNRLVQEERTVVHDQPGTTRDAIDSVVQRGERTIRFIDTAGLRRAVKTQGVEYYGLLRSQRAIGSAHVALLVLDASEGASGEDKRIAAMVSEAGRGLVVAANKWDLLPSEERAQRFESIGEQLAQVSGVPIVRTSALTGLGVGRVLPALLEAHDAWTRRIPTAEVNRILERATAAQPPPRAAGRLLYATQVAAGPPRFVVFGMDDPGPSYRRYLENRLRAEFGFGGVPIRLSFRPRHRKPPKRRTKREPEAR